MSKNGLILKKFITKPNYNNAIEVRIYDTPENMYIATHEWNKKNKNKYNLMDDFDAVVLENTSKRLISEKYVFATVFFCLNKLNYGVILHELVHATFVFFRSVLRFDGRFKKINGTGDDEEEIFCYTLEGFYNNFLNILQENKISCGV